MEKSERYKQQAQWKSQNRDRIAFEVPKGYREQVKMAAGTQSMNAYIFNALEDKIHGVPKVEIQNLQAYAQRVGMSVEEYVRVAVLEKMKRQDEEGVAG